MLFPMYCSSSYFLACREAFLLVGSSLFFSAGLFINVGSGGFMSVAVWDVSSQYYQVVPMVVDFHFNEVARVLYIVVSICSILWLKQNPTPWCSPLPCIPEEKMNVCVSFRPMFDPGIFVSCRHKQPIVCSIICNMICSRLVVLSFL